MGDLKEIFGEMREERRARKAKQQSYAPIALEMLDKSRFDYVILSEGHYRVEGIIDWWPSTGTWTVGKHRDHGIKRLLEYLERVVP